MSPGAVENLIAAEVGGRFTIRERTVNITTTVVEVFPSNPERASWLMINSGATEVEFGWSANLSAADSIPLAANGGGLSVNVREDFVLPIFQSYARVAVGTSTLRVIEVLRVSGEMPR